MSLNEYNVTVRNNFNITGATVTNVGTLTFPTSTTTIVGRDTTDTLTNKTITNSTMNSSTNTVGANNLYNGSSWTVALTGATAPVGSVLTVTSAGNAQFSTTAVPTTGSGTTTDGTTPLTLSTIAIPTNSVVYLRTEIVGKRTDTNTTGYAMSQVFGATYENVTGTVTQAGGAGMYSSQTYSDTNTAALTVVYTISGTNILVQITGLTGITFAWNSWTTARSV